MLVPLLGACSFTGGVAAASPAGSASPLSTASSPAIPDASAGSTPSSTSSSTSSGASSSSSGAASTTGSTAGGSSSSSTSTPTPGRSGAASGCATSALALSLLPGEGGGSAGHQHFTIQFTNRGPTACTVDGHPGVSLVTGASGQQLGAAASREGTPVAVRLGPGASAYADLSLAEAGNYDSGQCRPTAAAGLRVYPPDQTASAFVAADGLTGCASTSVELLVVDPVVAGR